MPCCDGERGEHSRTRLQFSNCLNPKKIRFHMSALPSRRASALSLPGTRGHTCRHPGCRAGTIFQPVWNFLMNGPYFKVAAEEGEPLERAGGQVPGLAKASTAAAPASKAGRVGFGAEAHHHGHSNEGLIPAGYPGMPAVGSNYPAIPGTVLAAADATAPTAPPLPPQHIGKVGASIPPALAAALAALARTGPHWQQRRPRWHSSLSLHSIRSHTPVPEPTTDGHPVCTPHPARRRRQPRQRQLHATRRPGGRDRGAPGAASSAGQRRRRRPAGAALRAAPPLQLPAGAADWHRHCGSICYNNAAGAHGGADRAGQVPG